MGDDEQISEELTDDDVVRPLGDIEQPVEDAWEQSLPVGDADDEDYPRT